jgi:hypothetical protein
VPKAAAPAGSSVADLLRPLVPELDARLKGAMNGLTGMVIRAHLPQNWTFVTERSQGSLVVSREATVLVVDGALPSPDVTVETSHARLEAALTTRDRRQVPPGPLTVTPHTEKGRRAFEFLRGRLGL